MNDNKIRDVAQAAAVHAEGLVTAWLPEGKRKGDEWETLNPVRGDRSPGSFHVNLNTGAFNDFADPSAKGGDLVSLRAYLDGVRQLDAARSIDHELSLGFFQEGEAIKPDPAIRAQREAIRKQQSERHALEEDAKQRAQEEAASRARHEWSTARPADPHHPYLARKGLPAYNLRQDGERLVVPLFHNGQLINLERIAANGDKRAMKGARKKGAYSLIGRLPANAPRVYVCEGWATGASLHRATGAPIVCAMTANNLALVASEIRAKFGPNIEILIAGDEDCDKDGNPGRTAALKAAEKARAKAVFPAKPEGVPDSAKWDFNDLDIALGDQGVTLMEHAVAIEVGKPNAPPIARPSFRVYETTTLIEGVKYFPGVWHHTIKASDDGGTPIDTRICAPLYVTAKTYNVEEERSGLLLRFINSTTRRNVEWVMPMRYLAGKADKLLEVLMEMGLEVAHRQRPAVQEYIASCQRVSERLETMSRPGWYEGDDDPLGCFVMPDGAIGRTDVVWQDSGKTSSPFTTKGSLAGWQHSVAPLCAGNHVLILAIGTALAGPLLRPLNIQGGGIHLVGDSSSGKSLAQLLAASVWGSPERFAGSWDVTPGGLEIEAATRNDTVLILDEIKRANAKRVQEMAYSLANGVGRSTMTRERESRARLTWRVLTLSSGERSLAEHAAIAGDTAHAGAELRMVDVDAGRRAFKAFDHTHGMDGATFHKRLGDSLQEHYGHLGRAFVQQLVERGDHEALKSQRDAIRAEFPDHHPQAGRVADRFAAIALAIEAAIDWELLPWPAGTGLTSAKQLYFEWLASFGRMGAEDRQILTSLHDFLQAHGDSRMSNINAQSEIPVRNRAGYYEIESGSRRFLMTRASLEEAAPGYGVRRILRTLSACDVILPGDGRNATRKYSLPGGGRERFYVLDSEALQTAVDQAA